MDTYTGQTGSPCCHFASACFVQDTKQYLRAHLGNEKPVQGIIEYQFGITEPCQSSQVKTFVPGKSPLINCLKRSFNPHGSIKVALWEAFSELLEGNTYDFQNLQVKKEYN